MGVADPVAAAHGLAAEATHPDFLSEPETDDDNAVLKSPMTPRCLAVATMTPSRFLARKIIDFEKNNSLNLVFGYLLRSLINLDAFFSRRSCKLFASHITLILFHQKVQITFLLSQKYVQNRPKLVLKWKLCPKLEIYS